MPKSASDYLEILSPLCHSPASHALGQVIEIVQRGLLRGGGCEAAEACAEVIGAAATRWRRFEGAYRDDISCIVLRLPCFQAATDINKSGSNER
ncbi:expressed unknown protein [Ectocarpus siliculosus]|uniref:Uncharacterized protein n=1 Tax=Ectocarpus siliculosus TaxID=2880 RepID=D7FV05_ECTSI|nr:expressed unknown protein [Ectocarpus siliculosus]|eukprot:CBJ31811.1 expressed unknown protein [Ectocarpus siliculosus]